MVLAYVYNDGGRLNQVPALVNSLARLRDGCTRRRA
jgi:hypothetical protein